MTSTGSSAASTFATRRHVPALRTLVIAAILGAAPLVAGGGCASCQSAPETGYEELNEVDLTEHLAQVGLGPGDVFEVRVYGEETLSGTHRVAPDGSVDVPLVGRVPVEGLTPSGLAGDLRDRFKDGYLRDPHVSVFVKEYNSKKIFVLGEVARPGTFTFSDGMNIVEAITLAGGFKPSANQNYVVVTRRDGAGEKRIAVPVGKISEGRAANLVLRPGDMVFVPDKLL